MRGLGVGGGQLVWAVIIYYVIFWRKLEITSLWPTVVTPSGGYIISCVGGGGTNNFKGAPRISKGCEID